MGEFAESSGVANDGHIFGCDRAEMVSVGPTADGLCRLCLMPVVQG